LPAQRTISTAIRALAIAVSVSILTAMCIGCSAAAPTANPTSTHGPTATPTISPTPTFTPTPTPHPNPNLRYSDEKQFILNLINEERSREGVEPLVLGANVAPQIHAENSLEGCYSSVWSTDGLKTDARYSLAGGYQANTGIASGGDFCSSWFDLTQDYPLFVVEDEIQDSIEGLLAYDETTDIREDLLDARFHSLNVGIALAVGPGDATVRLFLLLESDYIEFEGLPAIQSDSGALTLSGRAKNGVSVEGRDDLRVYVDYDPPPQSVTAGQIARVWSSNLGRRIASIRPPAGEGRNWTSDEITKRYNPCLAPHEVPNDVELPRSRSDAGDLFDIAKAACLEVRDNEEGGTEITYPWITTEDWNVEGDAFDISADLSNVIAKHGPGIYVVSMWGTLDGENRIISEYAIFHEITPPSTYDPPPQ